MALSKWFLCGAEGGFEKDESLAYTFAEKAARRGLPAAEFAMGYYWEVGIGTRRDVDRAIAWYEKVCHRVQTLYSFIVMYISRHLHTATQTQETDSPRSARALHKLCRDRSMIPSQNINSCGNVLKLNKDQMRYTVLHLLLLNLNLVLAMLLGLVVHLA